MVIEDQEEKQKIIAKYFKKLYTVEPIKPKNLTHKKILNDVFTEYYIALAIS